MFQSQVEQDDCGVVYPKVAFWEGISFIDVVGGCRDEEEDVVVVVERERGKVESSVASSVLVVQC